MDQSSQISAARYTGGASVNSFTPVSNLLTDSEVATLGGWLGRKRDRMGPIVLMRGMLLLLGMLSALETYGPAELQRLVREFATTFGLV